MNQKNNELLAIIASITEYEPITKTEKILAIGLKISKGLLAGKEIPLNDLRHHRYTGPIITTRDIDDIVVIVGGEIYSKPGKPGPAPKFIRRKMA